MRARIIRVDFRFPTGIQDRLRGDGDCLSPLLAKQGRGKQRGIQQTNRGRDDGSHRIQFPISSRLCALARVPNKTAAPRTAVFRTGKPVPSQGISSAGVFFFVAKFRRLTPSMNAVALAM